MIAGSRQALYLRRAVPAFAGLLLLTWLIWWKWIPWQSGRQAPGGLIGHAVFYVVFAWAGAAAITLASYLAVSVDDLADLAIAAVFASAPAMWLAPAFLLLSTLQPLWMAAGLLLIANTSRLLVSRRAPQRRRLVRAPVARSMPDRLFRTADVQTVLASGERFPAIAGAFAMQAGIYLVWAEYPLLSAAVIAGVAAIWTRSWMARGASKPRNHARPAYSLASVLLILLLATALSVGHFGGDAAGTEDEGLTATTGRVLQRLAQGRAAKITAPKQSATPVFSAKEEMGTLGSGIPGVILRSEQKAKRRVLGVAPVSTPHFSLSEPLTIPFTGEYHLFRTSSGHLPEGAAVQTGTPMNATYITTNGGTMETQAYQLLEPPIDFAHCAKVQLTLVSGEIFPGSASLQLIAGGRVEDLGTEIFGLESTAEETLNFKVPASRPAAPVSAIRVVFHHDPVQGAKSTKVAILRFTLVPQGR